MESTSSLEKETTLIQIKPDEKLRKYIMIVTWFVVLFVPTYSKVTTYSSWGPIDETTFFWPWMILTHLQPTSEYSTDQYTVIAFPWSFILFIPFYYILKLSYELSKDNKERVVKASLIVITSLVQIGLIYMSFSSQGPYDPEEKKVLYIPQLILFFVFALLAVMWFYEETQVSLTQARLKKERSE
ncbi:MAG: hypothetical protein ACXAD7_23885 [Candidatus Kariarchaeaceae archaeon]